MFLKNKDNFYIMSESQVKIQTAAFIGHPLLLFVSSQYAQPLLLLFSMFSKTFILQSGDDLQPFLLQRHDSHKDVLRLRS